MKIIIGMKKREKPIKEFEELSTAIEEFKKVTKRELMKDFRKLLCFLGFHRRAVFSQDGFNFIYCIYCRKEWHGEDI